MRFSTFLALLALTWSAAVPAAGGGDRLSRFLDGLTTLQASFEQAVVNAAQDHAVLSRGTFYLQRPGRFRWEYTEPEGQLIVADGSRVWLYDVELEQVSHQNQADALRGTPALLLSDTGPIDRHFQVITGESHSGLDWVELIPLNRDSEVSRVLLGFDGEVLDRLEMIDTFGQLTRFDFREVERNPELDPGLFRFDPPPGVDLLER